MTNHLLCKFCNRDFNTFLGLHSHLLFRHGIFVPICDLKKRAKFAKRCRINEYNKKNPEKARAIWNKAKRKQRIKLKLNEIN